MTDGGHVATSYRLHCPINATPETSYNHISALAVVMGNKLSFEQGATICALSETFHLAGHCPHFN